MSVAELQLYQVEVYKHGAVTHISSSFLISPSHPSQNVAVLKSEDAPSKGERGGDGQSALSAGERR